MAKHTKKSKKKSGRSVHARAIKRKIGSQRVNEAGRAAFDRQTRLNRGQDLKKDFHASDKIQREPSPGIKARAKNLRMFGEQVPVFTKGKRDKGGPIKRVAVKFRNLVSREAAKHTKKVITAKGKRPLTTKEKAEFKDIMTSINRLRNKRFRLEQEEKAMFKRSAEMRKR